MMDKKLDIFVDNKATVSSVKTSNKTSPKEGLSLFDQLLNDTKKSISAQKENKVSPSDKSNKNVQKADTDFSSKSKTIGTSSLLDKLILETKEKISQNDKSEIKNNNESTSSKIVKSEQSSSNDTLKVEKNIKNDPSIKINENIKTLDSNNQSNKSKDADTTNKNANTKINDSIKTSSNTTDIKSIIQDAKISKNDSSKQSLEKSEKPEKSVKSEQPENSKNIKTDELDKNESIKSIKENVDVSEKTEKKQNITHLEKSSKQSLSSIDNSKDDKKVTLSKNNADSITSSVKVEGDALKVDSKSLDIKKENILDLRNENKDEKVDVLNKKSNEILDKTVTSELKEVVNNDSPLKNDKNIISSTNVLSSKNVKEEKVQVTDTTSTVKSIKSDLSEEKKIKNDSKNINDSLLKDEKAGNFKDSSEVKRKNNISEKVLNNETKENPLQSEKNLKVNENTTNKNAANEFAKLSNEDLPLEKIKVTKEEILSKNIIKNESKIENSLDKNSEKVTLINEKIDVKASKESLLSNIFLSSQQRVVSRQEIQTLSENKKSIVENKNIDTLKTVAKSLELDLKEVKLDSKKSENKVLSKDLILDKLAFSKNILKTNIENILGTVNANIIENELNDLPDVTLNVSGHNLNTLETKIISARQNVSSLMSDIAKKMYENYKPPVTAFRMLLNPSTLGSISVIMKHDRESGLSISLNMSNQNTLEAMNENEDTLRSALSNSFLDESEFSLDFNMQGEGSKQEKEKETKNSTSEILEGLSNNVSAESLENNQNYM